LYDNLYPSRIIVGRPEGDERLDQAARTFAQLLVEGAIGDGTETASETSTKNIIHHTSNIIIHNS
jgi:UDPglucose 6-dehydrogenase